MLVSIARTQLASFKPSRATLCGTAAFLGLILGCESLQNAVAEGDTRTIAMHHVHTGETLEITYKKNGRYDEDALKKVNRHLRDWRTSQETSMEPRLIDVLWEVNREVGGREPIQIIGGYRAPATNAMLRRRSSGVARFSQHMLGKAIDFYIPNVPLADVRAAGLRLQRGGVGFYPTSGSPFVHVDIGSVRHWPRMTHDQLAKVFPDGRTVHVPSDGRPLKNYALALADLQRRGNTPSATSLTAARDAGVQVAAADTKKPTFLSRLFGSRADEDEDTELTSAAPRNPGTASRPVPADKIPADKTPSTAETKTAAVPLPAARPAAAPVQVAAATPSTYQLASAEPPKPVPAPAARPHRPSQAASLVTRAQNPNDVIKARGFWEGPAETPADPAPAARERPTARPAQPDGPVGHQLAAAEPATTASVAPNNVAPWPMPSRTDRVPAEIALSYAALSSDDAATAAVPPTKTAKTMPAPPRTTIAVKDNAERALTEQALAAHAKARYGTTIAARSDSPWMRALVLAPDVSRFMNTTMYGSTDLRMLQPQLAKPASAVMMTFAEDPQLGLRSDAFTGAAVVFVATVTFVPHRTAALP